MNLHHPVARTRLAAGLALLAASWLAAPAGAARVVDVRVGTHPTFTRVVFELDEAAGYRLTRSSESEPPAIVVTLDAAADSERLRSGGDIDTVRVQGGARTTARIALRKPGLRLQEMILANPPRIVLDVMREEPPPQVSKTPPPAPKAKPAPKPEPKPAPKAEVKPEPAPKPRAKPEPEPTPTASATPKPAPSPEPEAEPAPEAHAEPAVQLQPEPERAAIEPPKRPQPRSSTPAGSESASEPGSEETRAAKAPEAAPGPVARKPEPAERVQEPTTPPVPVAPEGAPPETARAEGPEPRPAPGILPPRRPQPEKPAPAKPTPATPAKPATPPEAETATSGGPGLVERVTTNPLLVGGAAGVLVLAVVIVLLVVRRRRAIPNDVDVSAIVEESESEGRVPAEGFAMDAAPGAGARAAGGGDDSLSSLFDDAPAPRAAAPAPAAPASDAFGFTESAAPATGAAASSLFDDDASQGDDAMSQNMDLPADRSGGPPPPPAAGGADGDVARLLQELERRVTALESKLDDANEAREKLERQVAAQSEELRVQRAAIARTQRALRTMTRADEDKATEPALRDDGETKTRVNV